ncbi:hypothetical protein BC938DRAFT_473821 [Jimgerdemannia flammicorona]|uniref:ATP synthase subunit 4 n=1 Tax=Jimgerdemannia flammicorona TaxID=994334 RepID=A0A433Q3I5_9FUNG|nr:hypothetical protein BC938DRAFT_473821 [Jimgerdemannia flammicorona]
MYQPVPTNCCSHTRNQEQTTFVLNMVTSTTETTRDTISNPRNSVFILHGYREIKTWNRYVLFAARIGPNAACIVTWNITSSRLFITVCYLFFVTLINHIPAGNGPPSFEQRHRCRRLQAPPEYFEETRRHAWHPHPTTLPSYSPTEKEVDPKTKASSIIDALPGNSLVSKTTFVTLGAGLATFLVSKEIYVLNEETLVLIATGSLFVALLKNLKEPYNAMSDEVIQRIKNVLVKAREDHKFAVQDRIDQVGQLKDIVDVTKGLFAISKVCLI